MSDWKDNSRVGRGGCWCSAISNFAGGICTSARRMLFHCWDWTNADLGFRVVMGVKRNDNKSQRGE